MQLKGHTSSLHNCLSALKPSSQLVPVCRPKSRSPFSTRASSAPPAPPPLTPSVESMKSSVSNTSSLAPPVPQQQQQQQQTHTARTVHSGSIELIMGAMFAGKTTELLRRVRMEQEKGLEVLLLKSNKDTRYTAAHISSHNGERLPCFEAKNLMAARDAWAKEYQSAQVIGIDESQFFSDLVEFVTKAADEDGKTVIVAGLDGDFQRRKFGQLLDLIPMADSISKLQGKCGCGKKSVFSLRRTESNAQELVGGAESYSPVCRSCYLLQIKL